ncbi:MAG TPA: hypothetical protein VLJ39_02355 [Tepidisphaeraceae bacterium]|nr:hypothetical protein [Tepidisphaeraceae bacterium]
MSQHELLRRVVETLDEAGIDYMLTGSYVSSLQGEPRSSHDIDLVVALNEAGASALIKTFQPPDYYLDEISVVSALSQSGDYRQFNLLDSSTGDKVDFWLLSDDAFDQSRFRRKAFDEIGGVRVKVSRPEDTILMKLRWASMSGGSEKQLHDALRVYELQFQQMDHRYLDEWAATLGVVALLDRIKANARPLRI